MAFFVIISGSIHTYSLAFRIKLPDLAGGQLYFHTFSLEEPLTYSHVVGACRKLTIPIIFNGEVLVIRREA